MIPEPEYVPRLRAEHLRSTTNELVLSLAVFGPGKGEACVVRLPDGQVGVLDGCRKKQDPVYALLQDLEVGKLAFVALTHPHDDHYPGLGDLMERWPPERVWRSDLHPRYMETLTRYLRLRRSGRVPCDSAAGELDNVFFRMNHSCYGRNFSHLQYPGEKIEIAQVAVRLYGPRSHVREEARVKLIAEIKGEGATQDPNDVSGAAWFSWREARILLAGDLTLDGWEDARNLIKHPVQVVNVAHHASAGAHDAQLWEKMAPELAIVTPFKNAAGGNPPRPDMIEKLAATTDVVITAPPAWEQSKTRPKTKNGAMPVLASSDTANAVAVSLNAQGEIVRLVLAGGARLYEKGWKAP